MSNELVHAPQTAVAVPINYTVQDMDMMAHAIVQGGFFPQFNTPAQAFSLMLLCQSKGLHPMQAIERYDIIQGRPAMKAQAMQAAFLEQGGRIEWGICDDRRCEATFSHPYGGSQTIIYTIEDAQRAGLLGKDIWKKYPRQMLRNRCVSEGVRTVLPGVTIGVYTPEEAEDFELAPKPKPLAHVPAPKDLGPENAKNVTPANDMASLMQEAKTEFASILQSEIGDHDSATRGKWLNRALGRADDCKDPVNLEGRQRAIVQLRATLSEWNYGDVKGEAAPVADSVPELQSDSAEVIGGAVDAADDDPFGETVAEQQSGPATEFGKAARSRGGK